MKPIISVIIPAYNEEEILGRSLKSLRDQKTKVSYEIIVCDNNSTDRTMNIARRYADKVISEKRQGISHTRNRGVKESDGEYLVHTDADTLFPSNFIEEVYKLFEKGIYAGFMCGSWNYYDGNSIKVKILARLQGIFFYVACRILELRNVLQIPGWCLCTPRKIFEKVGGFHDSDLLEDVYYSYAIEPYGKKAFFPKIRVRSSVRRLEHGVASLTKHYTYRGNGLWKFFKNMFRASHYCPGKTCNS